MTDTATETPVKEKAKKKGRRATKQTTGLIQRTFKKKDGTTYVGDIWYMRYSAPDPDQPGKMKKVFESTGTDNKTDALKELTTRKAAVYEDRHPELRKKNGILFEDFVNNHYLPHCKDQAGIKEKTQVCNALISYFGKWNINDVTAKMLSEYRKTKEARGNAPSSCNRHLATFRNIYTIANTPEFGYVSQAKLLEMRSVKNKKESSGRINYLSKAEIKTLLKTAEPYLYMHQIIRWAMNTGIRRGRTFKLTWKMIDLNNCFLHIPQDKHGDPFDAPLNEEAMKVLNERLADKKDDIPYVFWREDTRDRWYDLREIWDVLTEKAKLKDFHFHDLRHTFISWLVMGGVDIRTVKDLAGHKTLSQTMKYSHLSPEHKMQAVKMLSFEEEPEEAKEQPQEKPEEQP